ncbi:MAG: cation:proton antiporter [Opitutales bacterium]|nr:cation:proton antiporter [Opitutales bacterium]
MDGISFIQDLAIVLLAAGLAGALCKRVNLSVIVGYLMAGVIIGPYTPPFSFVSDIDRIQMLSQVGLVFLMFAIGLGLSLSKLGRMGLPTLLATALGAFFVINLTRPLGFALGWTTLQSAFVASIFLVSSSAVISKIITELKLSHEGSAQRAMAITVMEDVVAVVTLTVLASLTQEEGTVNLNFGALLATMSAFVVLLLGGGLFLVPRIFKRLEARADPELQTIIVTGLLFLLAIAAAKAGYSLALGAFLLGAIVAEMPQKSGVEKSFSGMRDVFSSVFFVSIGMMIDIRLLLGVWPMIIGLTLFAMIARPLATGLAMIITGTAPKEARRASLLLTPLGEFSFIIAQLGVTSAVLSPEYYPLTVGVSVLTVFLTPIVNAKSAAILSLVERLEPSWITGFFDAYHRWLLQLQTRKSAPLLWKLVRVRLIQIAVEMLLITGLLVFPPRLLPLIKESLAGLITDKTLIGYGFWSIIGLFVLILLFAIWRNVSAVAMILADGAGKSRVPSGIVSFSFRVASSLVIAYWLYLFLPIESLPLGAWIVIAVLALAVVAFFSKRLIYWHGVWRNSVHEVFSANAQPEPKNARARARLAMDKGLESWKLCMEDFIVPDNAAYAGQTIAQLSLPSRFGCPLLEIERNGFVITRILPSMHIYPGDKLLLIGGAENIAAATQYLAGEKIDPAERAKTFSGAVMDKTIVPEGTRTGKTLAELQITQQTGVRIVGIQRGDRRIISPDGKHTLEEGDLLLVVGTLNEITAFKRWLVE